MLLELVVGVLKRGELKLYQEWACCSVKDTPQTTRFFPKRLPFCEQPPGTAQGWVRGDIPLFAAARAADTLTHSS